MVVVAATLEVATIEHLAGKPLTGDTFEKRPGEQKLVGALTFAGVSQQALFRFPKRNESLDEYLRGLRSANRFVNWKTIK
jgi:hypothetical protein